MQHLCIIIYSFNTAYTHIALLTVNKFVPSGKLEDFSLFSLDYLLPDTLSCTINSVFAACVSINLLWEKSNLDNF